jgi:CBS domain-containing protein
MRNRSIHELPVLRGRHLVGMITFEGIARRTNLPLTTKVQHLMVIPPLITASTEYPELAEQLLAAGLRAAAVVGRKGELLGVVSRTDLVRALPNLARLAEHRVEEVAGPVGLVIKENETAGNLFAQIRVLEEHPLPVVDRKGRLAGAVGIADLGRILWKPVTGGKKDARAGGNVLGIEVATIMHSPAVTVTRGTSTGDAARRMSEEKVSSVFVVEQGKPVGVVSQTDLLGLAVGGNAPAAGRGVEDVYVQVLGLRGSSDPEVLTEIDRIVAKGLRHLGRHVRPRLLSLHVTPHATHRTGDATVQARLYSDEGIYYASQSGWNFFAGIADVMDELVEQIRRDRDPHRRPRRSVAREVPPEETPVDPELEEKLRSVNPEND